MPFPRYYLAFVLFVLSIVVGIKINHLINRSLMSIAERGRLAGTPNVGQ